MVVKAGADNRSAIPRPLEGAQPAQIRERKRRRDIARQPSSSWPGDGDRITCPESSESSVFRESLNRFANHPGQRTAVDREGMSGGEAGFVRTQEQNGVGDFLRLGDAAHRVIAGERLHAVGGAR